MPWWAGRGAPAPRRRRSGLPPRPPSDCRPWCRSRGCPHEGGSTGFPAPRDASTLAVSRRWRSSAVASPGHQAVRIAITGHLRDAPAGEEEDDFIITRGARAPTRGPPHCDRSCNVGARRRGLLEREPGDARVRPAPRVGRRTVRVIVPAVPPFFGRIVAVQVGRPRRGSSSPSRLRRPAGGRRRSARSPAAPRWPPSGRTPCRGRSVVDRGRRPEGIGADGVDCSDATCVPLVPRPRSGRCRAATNAPCASLAVPGPARRRRPA